MPGMKVGDLSRHRLRECVSIADHTVHTAAVTREGLNNR